MEHRVYPSCCTSAFCGRTECPPDCVFLRKKDAFDRWREKFAAIQPDPTWCPSMWEATIRREDLPEPEPTE